MRLSELKTGQYGRIVKILGHGSFRKRVMEMGFVKGKKISVELNAPLDDPIKYRILDYEISLRRVEAELIEVVQVEESDESIYENAAVIKVNDEGKVNKFNDERRTINVALIGNPNSGKTSLFNVASGAKERVGNYGGVTVDAKKGVLKHNGYTFNIVDLPGTYSLSAYSPEELYVRRYLHDEVPDVIINVVDASNLERNFYLTTELIDMDRSMVVALNMYDELDRSHVHFDHETLAKMVGVPIVPTVSKTGKGIDNLFDTIIDVFEGKNEVVRHIHISYDEEIENAVHAIQTELKKEKTLDLQFSSRYLAIKFVEKDKEIDSMLKRLSCYEHISQIRDKHVELIEKSHNEDMAAIIAGSKYGFVSGALKETLSTEEKEEIRTTAIIDSIVTNKYLGFPIFLLIMWFMFWATFEIGQYPMDWLDALVGYISELCQTFLPDGAIKDMIVDGVLGGVGAVVIFLPNILILYTIISFMEDSGYMARAAFIMDKIMHKIGLHGKSFIPLVMGFGCNVPAIMATRTIESHSSRLITILINPFMSCTARLPIYLLFVGAFFPNNPSTVLFGLYLAGILVAVITAKLLRKFHYKKDETPFVMELPPYRMPTFKATMRHMWTKGEQYLKKMGGVILVACLVIWALNYFPRPTESQIQEVEQRFTVQDTEGLDAEQISSKAEAIAATENSYLGQAGKFMAPVFEPLGFNWKMTISLISGTLAKETVVSTLGVLYSGDSETDETALQQRITQPNINTGEPDFNMLVAIGFLLFSVLYVPCIASIIAISKEAGKWKYGIFSLCYNTFVAWFVAFLIYQIGRLFI